MAEEHCQDDIGYARLSDPPKRVRTPSQYASKIADFKNDASLNSKKSKSIKFAQLLGANSQTDINPSLKSLLCTLPNGKSYSLKIVVNPSNKKAPQKREQRTEKRSDSPIKSKIQQQKKEDASICLLNKFLSAFQNLQKEQEKDSKQNNEINKYNKEIKSFAGEEKMRNDKEREERWNKCYEKFRSLSGKLDCLEENYLYLV